MLAMLLVAAPTPAVADELPPGGTFVDDDDSVHEGNIEAIADRGITQGCDDDLYCPRRPVTRGQMAAFLARSLGLGASSVDHFSDDDGHMFEPAINAIADEGITLGCDGGRFCPDSHVTRGQMAAFIARARGLSPSGVDHFSDDDGNVFEPAINAIADEGITSGCNPPNNTRFCAGDVTLRGQMATFLSKALELTPIHPPEREGEGTSVEDSIRRWFPENFADAWSVAGCESRHNPRAVNPAGYQGLFQIGEAYHRSSFERVTGQSWSSGIYVAYYNAQYARHLYEGNGWNPWSCKP